MNPNPTLAPAPIPSYDTITSNITLATSVSVTEGSVIVKRNTDRSENLYFLFIPLAVLATIVLMSVIVYLMARRRHKIMSNYHYVPSFSFEYSDMEEEREERETDYLLRGAKLRLGEQQGKIGVDRTAGRYDGSQELFA
ncbi:uncharacterized protein LOC131208823 [Anopheles bellator]|uniref:uncharacterized protein LOC131208823 n=1 Tax=Anopheles bellator TaxID=139047 RepID=UPI0026476E71|nr:uncharacterized protein LOC131208823 [Anopheles bellator]